MTRMGLVNNIRGAVTGAVKAGGSSAAPGRYPTYGMSMRFSVVVHGGSGPAHLGFWSSCSNLGMTIKHEELRQGGVYEHSELLPGDITYPPITLERAVDDTSSHVVQDWLRTIVTDWVNADEAGSKKNERHRGSYVTIKLYNAYKDSTPVLTWVLHNAIPTSWTGPTLSASADQIATEKLTLAYESFEILKKGETSSLPATRSATGDMGKLSLEEVRTGDRVVFEYRPTQVTLGKTITVANQNVAFKSQSVHNFVESGKLSVSVGELRLEGKDQVRSTVGTLMGWMEYDYPTQDAQHAESKKLRIALGPGAGLPLQVILKSVNVSYTRFAKDGAPIRAKVTLILEEHKQTSPWGAKAKPGGGRGSDAGPAPRGNLLGSRPTPGRAP
jgi:phage tail-like protein